MGGKENGDGEEGAAWREGILHLHLGESSWRTGRHTPIHSSILTDRQTDRQHLLTVTIFPRHAHARACEHTHTYTHTRSLSLSLTHAHIQHTHSQMEAESLRQEHVHELEQKLERVQQGVGKVKVCPLSV